MSRKPPEETEKWLEFPEKFESNLEMIRIVARWTEGNSIKKKSNKFKSYELTEMNLNVNIMWLTQSNLNVNIN